MNSVRIYQNDRYIILSSTDANSEKNIEFEDAETFISKGRDDTEKITDFFFSNKNLKKIIIRSEELDILFSDFISLFSCIDAAGGIVFNENNELLVIQRFGKIDLPKGKVEKGESIKDAAIREVSEECGITGMKIISQEIPTYHIYFINNKKCLKKTYWFRMIYNGSETPEPQPEEGITEAFWINKDEMLNLKKSTYKSLEHFFEL